MITPRQVNGFPRRNRLDHNTPAELAIRKAIEEVEKVGAHPKLTNIIVGLDKLRDELSDYIDAGMDALDEYVGKTGTFTIDHITVKCKVVSVEQGVKCHRCGGPWGTVEVTETTMLGPSRILLAGIQAVSCLNDIKFDDQTVTGSNASSTTAG